MTVLHKKNNIYSNTVELSTFDYINSFPHEINSILGCKSILKIVGGPNINQMTKKEFKITIVKENSNLKINKIKENIYEISSIKNGEYDLKIVLWLGE